MSKVALVRCEDYEYQKVKESVERGIELLGGAELFVKPGEKILFKPNWLVADSPEKLTTTHPTVFRAMLEVFSSTGALFSYGDSPAMQSPELSARKTGFLEVAEACGIQLADFKNGRVRRGMPRRFEL
jgi:uncharacterized protein (DUF362 family)